MLRAVGGLSRPSAKPAVLVAARSAARRRLIPARPALAGGSGRGGGFGGSGGRGDGGGGGDGGGLPRFCALLLCAALLSPRRALAAATPRAEARESHLSASVSEGVALIAHAVARMVPILVLTLFSYVLLASSLRTALSKALTNADVLVTGGFAVAGWLLSSFLDSVEKRFDKVEDQFKKSEERVDKQFEKVEEQFKKSDERVDKQFEKVDKQLEKLTELLTSRLLK